MICEFRELTDKFDNVTKTDDLVAAEERLAAVKKLEEIAGGSRKINKTWISAGKIYDTYDNIVFEGWRVLSKYFKTLKISKAPDGIKVYCFTYNKGIVSVDKIYMYARGKVRGVENLAILEKELVNLKYLRQTARKVYDKTPKNAERVKELDRSIKNIIKSLNNKKGLEKAGLLDNAKGNKKLFDYVLAIANKNSSKIKNGQWLTTVYKGPNSRVTVMSQWVKTEDGRFYLKTIKIF